jgi:IS6 family transposase
MPLTRKRSPHRLRRKSCLQTANYAGLKYLNNVIEQDHRAVRKRWRAMQCFRTFHTAERALEGVEALHMIRKGQIKRLGGRDTVGQAKFIASLFGVAA